MTEPTEIHEVWEEVNPFIPVIKELPPRFCYRAIKRIKKADGVKYRLPRKLKLKVMGRLK